MVRVIVMGSDARTHSVVWKLLQSPHLKEGTVYVVPGNAGTAYMPGVENRPDLEQTSLDGRPNFTALADFAKGHRVDLVVFCEERPLLWGAANVLRGNGITVFGPGGRAANRLEGSKKSCKELLFAGDIPTAQFQEFSDPAEALEYLKQVKMYPVYVKATGPVADRSLGVRRADTIFEARGAVDKLLRDPAVKATARSVLIEEHIDGPESSAHAMVDKTGFVDHWPLSQDHKHLFPPGSVPSYKNPYTGGMGAIVPVPWMSHVEIDYIRRTFTTGMVRILATRGPHFEGLLYPGIKGFKALEYNVRFGNPECQAYMRILMSDLFETLYHSACGRLREHRSSWNNQYAACIMLAGEGYGFPGKLQTGRPISGIDEAEKVPGVVVFHGGTRAWTDGTFFTGDAGRPLAVTSVGKTLREALARAYEGVERIHFDGMQFRPDIGREALALTPF